MTALDRATIAREVIAKLGTRRALDGTRPVPTPTENPTGFEGVDAIGKRGKYRARIRYCDALTGGDVRVTLGCSFRSAEEAGFAYATAHIQLWGALSYFVGELTGDDFEG